MEVLANGLNTYAWYLFENSHTEKALSFSQEPLDVIWPFVEKGDGEEGMETYAAALDTMANILFDLGRYFRGCKKALETVELKRKMVEGGNDSFKWSLAASLGALSTAYMVNRNTRNAVLSMERTLHGLG